MDVRSRGGEELLLLVQVLALGRDDTLRVEHHDILLLGADGHIELRTADGCSTSTIHHDLYILDVLADHLHRIFQSCCRDDGCTVLVVVHYGDVECLLQALLDVKALRRLDVFEVDASEGGSNALYGLTEFLGILLCHLDVEHVDTAIDLEKKSLSLHHRLAAHRTDVAQTEYSGAVRNHSYEVSLVRVLIRSVGVFLNFQTGIGHTRRVGETKVGLRTVSLCRLYFDFTRTPTFMIFKGGFF